MSKVPPQRTLTLILIITLFFAVLGLVAWTAVSSPVLGLTNSPVTPTLGQPFALVRIPKASATPTALSISSPIPVILPTASPMPVIEPTIESLVVAEIVVDTPAPTGYSNTTQYDAPPAYSGNKYILVDISEQHMYVYEGDLLVNDFVSSTGMNNATRAGRFSVLDKIPNAYGATWDIWMPNWLGIYWAGSMENGIHALPILPNGATLWAGYLGVPISYGCVVLGTYEAQWLYDWADIGTPVEIQW
jgi:lipoprotein-anchoring transpeptidase ErfK/SrfK